MYIYTSCEIFFVYISIFYMFLSLIILWNNSQNYDIKYRYFIDLNEYLKNQVKDYVTWQHTRTVKSQRAQLLSYKFKTTYLFNFDTYHWLDKIRLFISFLTLLMFTVNAEITIHYVCIASLKIKFIWFFSCD